MVADEQRGQERADEVDPVRACVRIGLFPGELSNLRTGEALKRAGPGEPGEHPGAAHGPRDGRAFSGGARVHPDWRRRPGPDAVNLSAERARRIEGGEGFRGSGVQIDATVLLGRSADGDDVGEIEARVLRRDFHHPIERLGPHGWRRMRNRRVVGREDAVSGAVLREGLVVRQHVLPDHAADAFVHLDGDGRQTLRAGVESKEYGHRAR